MKKEQVNKMLFGIAWYMVPLVILLFSYNAQLHIASISTVLMLTGWTLGGVISTQFILVDFRDFKVKYFIALGSILILVTGLLQIRALVNQQSLSDLMSYRLSVFEDTDFLFGSSVLYTLYNSFLLPILLFCVPLFMYFLKDDKVYKKPVVYILIAFIVLLLTDGLIRLGRFPVMWILFFIIYFKNYINIRGIKLLFVFLFGVPFMQLILYYRQYSAFVGIYDVLSSWDILMSSVLSYNMIGFILFNQIANIQPITISPLNFNFLAPYLYYFEVFLGRFDLQIWYPWKTLNLDLSQPRYLSELNIIGNAFGTNMLPAYFDYGYLGPFLIGLFLGFLSLINTRGVISWIVPCIAFFVMIFGIYKPVIVSPVSLILVLPFLFSLVRIYRVRS